MKRILLTLIMSLSFFSLFGRGQQEEAFKSIDAKAFAVYIQANDVTLLDVRTPEEHAQGFIPGTDFNIDVLNDKFTTQALKLLPKDKPVALYCRSGNRSKKAARILSAKGYTVIELGSGFNGWTAAGMKTSKQ